MDVQRFIVFIFLYRFQTFSAAALNVSAVLGQTAELPCFCLKNKSSVGMEVTRSDNTGQYVIFIRDGRSDETRQIPRYSGRVTRTSDWALLIRNVTHKDEGTFLCNGYYKEPGDEHPKEVVCSVTLTVIVSAVHGQTAKLPCFCLEDKQGVAMTFTRLDTPGGQHVIFVRDNRSEKANQIPRYIGKVGWENWALLIRNVTHRDKGTFICNGYYKEPGNEHPEEVVCSVTLTVIVSADSVSGNEHPEEVQSKVTLTVTGGEKTSMRLPKPTTPAAEEEKKKEQMTVKFVVPSVVLILIFLVLFLSK